MQINFAQAYETLAEFIARRYGNDLLDSNRQSANLMRSLVDTYPEVFESIEANPHEWTARVNDYIRAQLEG